MAEEKKKSKGVLVAAAEALGGAAGKVASIATPGSAGAGEEKPAAKNTPATNIKQPKLAPKNKSRLPRKEKKALQTKNAAADAKR